MFDTLIVRSFLTPSIALTVVLVVGASAPSEQWLGRPEMTLHPSEFPDVSSYLDLIDRFMGRDISAPDFEKFFLRAMKSERRTLGDPVYPILQELFEDADACVEQSELRTEPEDLDDEQLLASAVRARHALRGIGYE
jgi:hypothetical protein